MLGIRQKIFVVAALNAMFMFCNSTLAQNFEIRFNLTGATDEQEAVFEQSAAFWESVILGYQDGVNLNGVDINVNLADVDGTSGTLAFAGPTNFAIQNGTIFSTAGQITIDTADFGNPFLQDIINHEVAHVLGFGTLFEANGLFDDNRQFIGEAGVAAFQDEFDPNATFVPIEDEGGPGTAGAHLDEVIIENVDGDIIGVGLTGITDQFGRDLSNELLTGVLGPNPNELFLSNTTVATFADLGFVVQLPNAIATVAVPEPTTLVLLMLGGVTLMNRRTRQDS